MDGPLPKLDEINGMDQVNKPVIVVTDGFTLNPGDLSWDDLATDSDFRYYDRTPADLVAARCADATVIITNKTPVTRATVTAAPHLRVIAVAATGHNIVDSVAASEKNIPVCNVPEYGTYSVAQHALALVLELTNHVGLNGAAVAEGGWSAQPDFCFSRKPMTELLGKTVGVVGMGRIGQQFAIIMQALGCKIVYNARSAKLGWQQPVSMEELFERSDIVSLHCPLTRANAGFVNKELLARMKPHALLINTARGALINETDLSAALRNRTIGGAALDVLSEEPPAPGHPLIGLPNCIVTPHTAWMCFEARERVMKVTVENVRRALEGTPQNVVNK